MSYSYKYPRPALTVDCAVFVEGEEGFELLLIERAADPFKGSWALPGGFVDMDETAERAAARELEEETGMNGIRLQQIHTFSTVDRDPRDRVVSVAFWGIASERKLRPGSDAKQARWFKVSELPPLAFDHQEIINMALDRLELSE